MKRIFTLAAVVVLSVGAVFADTNKLMDFTKLVPDITVGTTQHNKQTVMDFSTAKIGVGSFTEEQRAQLRTSLAYEQWLVELASSSKTTTNIKASYVKQATSSGYLSGGNGETPVMGVRIHFPVEPFNSWALVKPAFDIPAYNFDTPGDDGSITPADLDEQDFYNPSRFEDGYGVIKNVGVIKSIKVSVYGRDFPHSLSLVYEDSEGVQKTVPMGSLNFDGWQDLTWQNPSYIQDVRARSLRLYPLYPANSSYIKFVGLLIQRDAANVGGDFVAYFKDVEVMYDKAMLDQRGDVDDEGTWHIRRDREIEKTRVETENFGSDQVLRYLEGEKQAKLDETFTPAGGNAQ